MRSVTLLVTPPAEVPTNRLFDDNPEIERERIYNLNVLEDGTMVLLGRIRGDLDLARRSLEERPDVLGFSISSDERGGVDHENGTDRGNGGDGGLVFVHARLPPPIERFLSLPREHEVFFEFPVEATRDGRLRLVLVGESNERLQRALAAVPGEMDVTVERIGPYAEGGGDLRSLLTERQREVLDVALDLGYYEVPRRATHREIAAEIDLSVATVSEHLQKIEARVFGALDAG